MYPVIASIIPSITLGLLSPAPMCPPRGPCLSSASAMVRQAALGGEVPNPVLKDGIGGTGFAIAHAREAPDPYGHFDGLAGDVMPVDLVRLGVVAGG